MRNWGEIGAATLLLTGGLVYLLAAFQYPLGELAAPGPGLMPRLLGWIFIGLSAYLLGSNFYKKLENQGNAEASKAEPSFSFKVPLQLLIILILYWAALTTLGFSLSTFLAMVFLSRLLGLAGWVKPIILGISAVALANLLFALALDVPLPLGTIWER